MNEISQLIFVIHQLSFFFPLNWISHTFVQYNRQYLMKFLLSIFFDQMVKHNGLLKTIKVGVIFNSVWNSIKWKEY